MAWTSGNLFAGGATIVKVDDADIGATTDGIRIRRETDWLDFEVDQVKFKVRKESTLSSMFIETTCAEATLDNVRIAWSMPSSAILSSSSLDLVEPAGTEEVTFYAEGPTVASVNAVAVSKRVYDFGRCVAMANGEINLNRGTPSQVPLNLEVLADNSSSPVVFGYMYELV
jgi:hypothetical protein